MATAAQAAVYKDKSGLGGGRICDSGVLRYKAD